MAKGRLKLQTFKEKTFIPIDNTKITVSNTTADGSTTGEKTYALTTNSAGLTNDIELDTPPIEYSQNPSDQKPYSLCNITVEREGFSPIKINGCQVYPNSTAYQVCNLTETKSTRQVEVIDIPANTLVGTFPPKIPEDPIKPLPPPTSGVVLSEVVVPGQIVVHAGSPNDDSAPNYTVDFKDYIKNVISSEIFPNWSTNTIRANIFCVVSFTLNRVFTEWYRGKGKPYQITNSTAYDQAFNYGRNIFDNVSALVDEMFSTYVKRPGNKQPLFTQYCDGKSVTCPGWLSQWGSKYLGDEGKTPYQIITNYYGNNIELVTAKSVAGIPSSYPGYTLTIGSKGIPVRDMQTYLNRISQNYPLIPKLAVDGAYGPKTAESVKVFQQIFTLPVTGQVDYATWYKISDVYVGVSKIAELRSTISPNYESIYDEFLGVSLPYYFYEN
ncbi:peptidoglycan-binding protein [Inconstantimicrobium mannanitabidum]|uniref:Spore cortex-lytic protein n=1 Tax=Inconstantimicrobium mannanitabidum TaxID=1604901 RepID=A0ACB5RF39_9CLOT|nr:peptidoglycan-binding protein [Clostridium sp. TW13]GKX67761.1 spore cortex-lytic protein [Clostridium sp. TW13]